MGLSNEGILKWGTGQITMKARKHNHIRCHFVAKVKTGDTKAEVVFFQKMIIRVLHSQDRIKRRNQEGLQGSEKNGLSPYVNGYSN